ADCEPRQIKLKSDAYLSLILFHRFFPSPIRPTEMITTRLPSFLATCFIVGSSGSGGQIGWSAPNITKNHMSLRALPMKFHSPSNQPEFFDETGTLPNSFSRSARTPICSSLAT